MNPAARRQAFRTLLSGSQCVYPASVFDAMSARLAEDTGYECTMLAGSVASMAVLGAPDLMVLTLTEFADLARRIGRGGSLPLIVDADHGYGNALSVQRTVDELETAGVAAITIEDTLLPTPYGSRRTVLVPIDEAAGKIRAAAAAKQDPDLVVFARTSLKAAGLEEIVERVRIYQDSGADAVFVRGVGSWAELDAIAGAARVPIMLGSPDRSIMDRPQLAARGVRVCLQSHRPFAAAVRAVAATYEALRAGADAAAMPPAADEAMLKALKREDGYRKALRSFAAVID